MAFQWHEEKHAATVQCHRAEDGEKKGKTDHGAMILLQWEKCAKCPTASYGYDRCECDGVFRFR